MNFPLEDVFTVCIETKNRDVFDQCVLYSIFGKEKVSKNKRIEAILYLLCGQDEEAESVMCNIDIEFYEKMFRSVRSEKWEYCPPKWIEEIVGKKYSYIVYETFLDFVPPGGIVKCTEEDVTIRFLRLLSGFLYIFEKCKQYKEKKCENEKNVLNNIFMYIAHNMGIQDMLKIPKKEKVLTKHFKGNTKVYDSVLLLSDINLSEFSKTENIRFIYDWYKVAYNASPIDWENLEDEDARYISGFNIS